MLSRVPDETCAKGAVKPHDAVLRPLLASSPEVMSLVSPVMSASGGASARGGPRGDGSSLTSSMICTEPAEDGARSREGCLLPSFDSVPNCLTIL